MGDRGIKGEFVKNLTLGEPGGRPEKNGSLSMVQRQRGGKCGIAISRSDGILSGAGMASSVGNGRRQESKGNRSDGS